MRGSAWGLETCIVGGEVADMVLGKGWDAPHHTSAPGVEKVRWVLVYMGPG